MRTTIRVLAVIGIIALLSVATAQAQTTYTWDPLMAGAGGSDDSSGTYNWDQLIGDTVWYSSAVTGDSYYQNDPTNIVNIGASGTSSYVITMNDAITLGTLNFTGTSGASYTIAPNATNPTTDTLTTYGGINLSAGVGPTTIGAPVVLGGPNIWTNSSSSLLTVSGTVNVGGYSLGVSGGGSTKITGALSSTSGGSVNVSGTGTTLTLGSMSAYSGTTNVGAGSTLTLTSSDTTTRSIVLNGGTLSASGGTVTDVANLVDRYTFAGNANDSIGTTNGVLGAGATVLSTGGKFGNGALSVNGAANATVTMGTLPTMTSGTQARTISAWVEQTATPGGNFATNYFGFAAGPTKSGNFYFDNNGGVVLTEYYDDSNSVLSNAAANNTWHLLTATWDGNDNDAAQIYVDGALAGTLASNANGGTNILDTFGINIGPNPNHDFTGLEDDLRVYNTALTPAQVAAIYNGGAGDAGAGLSVPDTAINVTASSSISAGGSPTFGNLSITNSSTLALSGIGSLTFGATTMASNTTLDLGGVAVTTTSLSDASATGTIITNSSSSPVVLTLSPASGTSTYSGLIQDGAVAGGVSLKIAGTGTGVQVLAGGSTYTGGTTVSTGTLRVTNTTGSATGTGPVTVASGALLGGGGGTTGAIGGAVTISSGGILSPNGGTGTVTNLTLSGGLTLANSSVLDYVLGSSSDQLTVGTSLSLGSGVALNVTQGAGFAPGLYPIISYGSSTLTGASNLGSWTASGLPGGDSGSFSRDATNHLIDFTVVQQGAALTWTGLDATNPNNWDYTSNNWGGPHYSDGTPPYVLADSVTFASGAATGNVNVTGNFSPTSVNITATDQPFTFSGTGSIGGTGGLTVNTGSQTVTMGIANSYSGGTRVTSGTLNVTNTSGSATGTGAVALSGASTLTGTGFITGPVTVSLAKIAGSSGNTLTLSGGLTIQWGAVSNFSLLSADNNNANALVATTNGDGNSFTFSSGIDTINLSGTVATGTYDLYSYTGTAPSGTFQIGTNTVSTTGMKYTVSVGGGQVDLNVSPAAAPSTTWYWDADTSGTTANASNGAAGNANGNTWNTTSALWWNGSVVTDAIWSSSSSNTTVAYFGGGNNNASVTVQGTAGSPGTGVYVGGLYFDSNSDNAGSNGRTGYLLTGGEITLNSPGVGAPTITVNMTGGFNPNGPPYYNSYTEIDSVLNGSSGINFAGNGAILLTNAANSFTGGINIGSGTTVLFNNAAVLNGNAITLNNGTVGGLVMTANTLTYAGNLTTGANGGVLDVGYNNGGNEVLTLTGNLSTGAGNFYKNDNGVLSITSDNSGQSYSGSIVVNGGQIKGTFGATASSTANPLGSSSANYILNGSGSIYALAAAAGDTGSLGNLTIGGGNMLAIDSSTTGTNTIALTFNNLAQTNAGQGTLIVESVQSSLGVNEQIGIVAFNSVSPVTNGMIAPWAITSAGTNQNQQASFLTYSGGSLRAANVTNSPSNYYLDTGNANTLSAAATTSIVQLDNNQDHSLPASTTTIYALRDDGQSIVSSGAGTATLSIASGGLILNGGLTIGSNSPATTGVNIDFGSTTGYIYTNSNNATIDNALSGSAGITTFGSNGTLTLGYGAGDATPNTYSGTFRVNGGTVALNAGALPTSSYLITGNLAIGPGASLGNNVGNRGIVILDANNQIASTSTVTINDGGLLNLNNSSQTINNLVFNGAGQVTNGTLTITGNITAAPTTTGNWNTTDAGNSFQNYYAEIGNPTNGQPAYILAGTSQQTISVTAAALPSALNNNSQELTIDAQLTGGPNGFVKTGTGVLFLDNTNNSFSGPVSVTNGILRENGTVNPNSNSSLGNSNSAITLGDTAGNNNVVFQLNLNNSNFGRNIVVGGSPTGTGSVTIESINSGNNSAEISGNITLNRSVTFAVSDPNGGGGFTDNGGFVGIISGNYGVTLASVGSGTGDYGFVFNSPANSWTGPTVINGGTVVFNAMAASPTSPVTLDGGVAGNTELNIANGQTFQIASLANGTATGTPGIVNFGNNNGGSMIIGDTGVTGSTTFSGPILLSQGGTFIKTGSSTQIFNPPANLTGSTLTTWADAGTIQYGSVAMNTAVYNILPGGTLAFDSSSSPGTLARTTSTNNPSVADGGTITITGNPANNTVDTFTGTFALDPGNAAIAVTPGTGKTSQASFGTWSRNTGGTIVFSGPNLGAATGINVAQITFTASPVTIAGGSLGTTAATILPWATGDTTPGGTGIGFVTYDTNGVRLLTTNEYTSSFTAGQNVQITASAADSAVTVQSLFLNNSALSSPITLSGGSTLTVNQAATGGNAGAILSIGSTGANANVISAPLAFTQEAIIDTIGDLNITGGLTLNNQLFTKTGAGTLTLSASSPLTTNNTITINGGKVILGAANAINTTSGTQVNINGSGTVLDMGGFNQVITNLGGFGNNGNNNGVGAASSAGGIITSNTSVMTPPVSVLTLNSSGGNTFYGGIQDGTSRIALIKNGNNTQTFWTNSATAFSNYSGTTTEVVSGTTYTGTTFINAGTLVYHVNQTLTQSVSLGASGSTIVLSGGNFEYDPMQFDGAMPSPVIFGTTTYGNLVDNNAFIVTPSGGGLFGESLGSTNLYTDFTGPISLGGALTINGQGGSGNNLLNRYQGTITLVQSGTARTAIYYQQTGGTYNSSLDGVIQDGAGSASNPLVLRASGNGNVFNVTGVSTYAGGTVIDAPSTTNPQSGDTLGLINVTAAGQSALSTPTATGSPPLTYASDAKLGTGNVLVQPGSMLRLNAADNTAAGATVTLGGGASTEMPVLGIGYNAAPSGLVAPNGGVLAIDTTAYTTNLTMSSIGNGSMFLGSTGVGTYGGSSLAAGNGGTYRLGGGGGALTFTQNVLTAGPNLVVDQVGGLDPDNATFLTGVLNGQGAVKFTVPQTNFTGTITVNGNYTAGNGNSYYDSILETVVPNLTGQVFGTGANNVVLSGGSVLFDMPSTANKNTGVTFGNLTVDGGPSAFTTNNAGNGNGPGGNSGSAVTINGSMGIVRNNNATLYFGGSAALTQDPAVDVIGPSGQLDYSNTNGHGTGLANGTGGTLFQVTNNSVNGTVTNAATAIGVYNIPGSSITGGATSPVQGSMITYGGSVAPWILYSVNHGGGDFLTYGTSGFQSVTYSVGNVIGVMTFATGSQMVNTVPSDMVDIDNTGGNTDSSMTTNTTIFAMHTIKSSGTVNIQGNSANAAPVTLTLTSGGLSVDEQNGNFTIGVAGTTATPVPNTGVNVQFGDGMTTEAVIWASEYNAATSITLQNLVSSGALTKTGPGVLNLDYVGTNAIHGNVTIDAGDIITGLNTGNAAGNGVGEFDLGSGNTVVLNGGGWLIQSDTAANITHPIQVGPAGGTFGFNSQQTENKTYSGSISNATGMPVGVSAGPLTFAMLNNGTMTLTDNSSADNKWSGGTVVTGGGTAVVQNGVNFGTGDVTVEAATLTFQGATSLGATTGTTNFSNASLSINQGATVNFQSIDANSNAGNPNDNMPSAGALAGSGSLVLGNATGNVATILTIGNNGISTVFDGVISQAGSGLSGITKVGSGTLTLAGINTYTGPTNVNNGTLRINGSQTGTGPSALVTVGDQVATHAATLAGTGFVAAPVMVNGPGASGIGGTIAGTSGATLTLNGGLTLNSGSIPSFTLTAAGVSNPNALISTTTLSYTGGDTVSLFGQVAIGTYDLISYTGGAPSGTFGVNSSGVSTQAVSYAIDIGTANPNQVDLVVSAANVDTWTNANGDFTWKIAESGPTYDWSVYNGTSTAPGPYSDGDNVVFGDGVGSSQVINIAAPVHPNGVQFNNQNVNYTVGGSPIAGNGSLSLDATGTVTATVTLTGANTYSGGTTITNGSLRLGASSSGGSNASVASGPVGIGTVTIGATSGGNNTSMYLAGTSPGVSLGNTIVVASGGSGTVTIGGQNTSGIDAFSGSITLGNATAGQSLTISEPAGGELDVTGGILAGPTSAGVTINGGAVSSVVKLTSGSSTYAGTTTVSSGTLRVTNTSGSATGTGPVNVSMGAVLGGGAGGTSGMIGGAVTIAGGADLAPNGFTGTSSPGTVTTLTLNGGLTLSNGASLDYILGTSSDLVTLGGSGHTLTLGTGVTLNVTQAAGFGLGTYDLINYGSNTAADGVGHANLSSWTDPTAGTYQIATFVDTGTEIDLDLTQGTASAFWNFAGGGSWSDITKWNIPAYPNGAGQTALFGTGTSNSINNGSVGGSSITITNNVNPTLGTLTLDNPTVGYTITGGTVTMNNNNAGAAVNVNSGSQSIASNIVLTDTHGTTFTVAASSSLGVSGSITNSSGAATAFSVGSGGSLTLSGGMDNGGQLVTFSGAGNTTVSNVGISGGGGLTYNGGSSPNSVLTLAASNGYTGATQVNSGTLFVANTGTLSATSGITVGGASASGSPMLSGSDSGTIGAAVTINALGTGAAGHLAPSGQLAANGIAASPTTTMTLGGGLTLADGNGTSGTGAALDFNLSTPEIGDLVTTTSLYLGTDGVLNFNGSLSGGATYPLIDFTTQTSADNSSTWSVGTHNGDSGHTYSFQIVDGAGPLGSDVFELVVTGTAGSGIWTSTSSDDFGLGTNWSSGSVPGQGKSATFGQGSVTTVMLREDHTVGQLIFDNTGNPIPSSNYTLIGSGSLTLDNGVGGGTAVSVSAGLMPAIYVPVLLNDSNLTTNFTVTGTSTLLDVAGAVGESTAGEKIVLMGGGTLEFDNSLSNFSGGITIVNGTLTNGPDMINGGYGTFGTGPLTFNPGSSNTATLAVNNPMTVNNLSETPGSAGTAQINIGTSGSLIVNQTVSGSYAGTISVASSGTLAINVNAGTFALANNTTQSISGAVSATVASGATLQLAGSASALSNNDGSNAASIANRGTLNVTGTNQTVGVVAGMASASGPTTYDGDTVVGNGSSAANLTATQILQNSLTINAGSTVTIAPAGDPPAAIPAASGAVAATPARSVSEGDAADSDPFTAIQAAIDSGAISSTTGQVLENRIAAIERLAAVDPGLDASLLESRVLAALPSSSTLSAAADSSPIIDGGASLLALDSSSLGSGLAASAAFAPSVGFAGSPAAVPEPTSLALACLAAIGLAFAVGRRLAGSRPRAA